MHFVELILGMFIVGACCYFVGVIVTKFKTMSLLHSMRHSCETLSNMSEECIKAYIKAIIDVEYKL